MGLRDASDCAATARRRARRALLGGARFIVVMSVVTGSVGCPGPSAGPGLSDASRAPGQPVARESTAGSFSWKLRLVVTQGDATRRFDALLEQEGDELRLVGLTPSGVRAFVLRQRDQDITFQPSTPLVFGVPPRALLADVQRVFFSGLSGAPRADGLHDGVVEGERVREAWRAGRLQWREFPGEPSEPGAVRIRYEGGWLPGAPPPRVVLANARLGYGLTLDTLPVDTGR